MAGDPLFVGIDVGTSGVRAVAIDDARTVVAIAGARMDDFGASRRDPAVWRKTLDVALAVLLDALGRRRIRAISIDGTSGTMLAIDEGGEPVAPPLMYNDPVDDTAILDRIASYAPATSAAHGATSALARAISLQNTPNAVRLVHQADWVAGLFSGRFDVSDANNALKTGYDPVEGRWPGWIAQTGVGLAMLPGVVEPGTVTGTARGNAARHFALDPDILIVAGTTDGCASFLATGASQPGDGVTALGTTLTIKLLCDAPIFAPEYGIYSHRITGGWLAGGASNSGGNVISAHFDGDEVRTLSRAIQSDTDTGLDYYPLARPGERFPFNDPAYKPRMTPRPDDDTQFLKAILEGIAEIEALGYRRLAELGAPELRSVRTVGGGAANEVWSRIRQRRLGVALESVLSEEAAMGAALLALAGAQKAGLPVAR